MNKVAGYRKMLGYTQESLAKEFGISTQAYWKKERGDTQFSDQEKKEVQRHVKTFFPKYHNR